MTITDHTDSPEPGTTAPLAAPPTAPPASPSAPSAAAAPASSPQRPARRGGTIRAVAAAVVVIGLLAGLAIALAANDSAKDAARLSESNPSGEDSDVARADDVRTPTDAVATVAPSAPTDASPATSAPPPAPVPAPELTSISAPATVTCEDGLGQENQLTLQWSAIGAESVRVSIDSPDGVFTSGLPATGSLAVPAPCAPDSNTYYVTAVGPDGRTTTSSTTTVGG